MLVFDLADATKALAQFDHSSKMVALILATSQEATEQFVQATEAEEAFLVHCSHLRLDFLSSAFGLAKAAALPSNMVDAGLHQMVSSIAGGCYEPSCDTLPQPLTLAGCLRVEAIWRPAEAVQHLMDDAYNLNLAFVGLCELLDL